MLILIFSVFIIHTGFAAHGDDLGPSRLLRKISRKLRGPDPSPEDQAALQKMISENPEGVRQFLDQKTTEYMNSEAYVEKIRFWLTTLMGFKADHVSDAFKDDPKRAGLNSYDMDDLNDAASNLFRDMARMNLSWDTLLTGKSYHIESLNSNGYNFGQGSSPLISEFSFFSGVPEIFNNRVKNNDPRVAGVLTTRRYWLRYGASFANENRRQAAGVFKVFLCDPMKPVFVVAEGDDRHLIDEVFSLKTGSPEKAMAVSHMAEVRKLHGSQVSCKACHYKLDPLGQTFSSTELGLSSTPTKGILEFQGKNGPVKIPGNGIGDLARAITKTPDYEECQMKHLWSRFIDPYHDPSDTQMQELTTAFDSAEIGRRTNSFIAYLTHRPEFLRESKEVAGEAVANSENGYGQSSQNGGAADTVQNPGAVFKSRTDMIAGDEQRARFLLNRCNSCHRSAAAVTPDLTQWPIGGSLNNAKMWVNEASRRLKLPSSDKDAMPQDRSNWAPADLKLINTYFQKMSGGL